MKIRVSTALTLILLFTVQAKSQVFVFSNINNVRGELRNVSDEVLNSRPALGTGYGLGYGAKNIVVQGEVVRNKIKLNDGFIVHARFENVFYRGSVLYSLNEQRWSVDAGPVVSYFSQSRLFLEIESDGVISPFQGTRKIDRSDRALWMGGVQAKITYKIAPAVSAYIGYQEFFGPWFKRWPNYDLRERSMSFGVLIPFEIPAFKDRSR